MTDEERRAKDAARKREAYARRKKQEEQARMQDFRRIAEATPNPLSNEQQEQAVQQIEEAFRKAQGNSTISPFPPGVLYKDNHKDELADILAASEERGRRTKLIMSMYQRDASNMNKLLWHILETLTRMRIEMVDLIGGLCNGK